MKRPTRTEIEKAKSILKQAGYLEPMWMVEDVKCRLEQLDKTANKKQLNTIVANIERSHNAEIGINWDVIDINIHEVLGY